jgi:hypothetical protein
MLEVFEAYAFSAYVLFLGAAHRLDLLGQRVLDGDHAAALRYGNVSAKRRRAGFRCGWGARVRARGRVRPPAEAAAISFTWEDHMYSRGYQKLINGMSALENRRMPRRRLLQSVGALGLAAILRPTAVFAEFDEDDERLGPFGPWSSPVNLGRVVNFVNSPLPYLTRSAAI